MSRGERVDVQVAVDDDEPPEPERLREWAAAALTAVGHGHAAVTLRIVATDEGRTLNRIYRGRDYATNVLSFPFAEVPPEAVAELGGPCLGDVAICARVVAREAVEQGKPRTLHWAHMTVHGILHLAGFDHTTVAEAETMEARERAILAEFGFADPYALAFAPPPASGEGTQ